MDSMLTKLVTEAKKTLDNAFFNTPTAQLSVSSSLVEEVNSKINQAYNAINPSFNNLSSKVKPMMKSFHPL